MTKSIFILFFLPIFLFSQKDYSSLFEEYMNAQVQMNDFAGTVLVAQKGSIIYKNAFGLTDRELNVKNSIQSKYQVASVTKQFTACSILLLVEEGKLKLDDKLSRFYPTFPKADSVTIHMLLNHTSGLKTSGEIPGFDELATLRQDSIMSIIAKQGYAFSPGTAYKYSNCAYYILGFIISKLSGKTYNDFVFEKLIKKASLENTMVNRWDTILTNRAKGYENTPIGLKNSFRISIENRESSGGLISTVEDLYRWNLALNSTKIISQESLKKMTTNYMNNYGYGIGIDTFYKHVRFSHGGTIRGFKSSLIHFPDDFLEVVVLSNNESNASYIANALSAIALDIPVVPPYPHIEIKLDSNVINNYVGKYLLNVGEEIQLIKSDGKLFRKKGNSQIELKAESTTKFFYGDGSDRQIEFIVDPSGKILTIYFIIDGIKEEIKLM